MIRITITDSDAVIKTKEEMTENIQVKRGVRHPLTGRDSEKARAIRNHKQKHNTTGCIFR